MPLYYELLTNGEARPLNMRGSPLRLRKTESVTVSGSAWVDLTPVPSGTNYRITNLCMGFTSSSANSLLAVIKRGAEIYYLSVVNTATNNEFYCFRLEVELIEGEIISVRINPATAGDTVYITALGMELTPR